MGSLNNSACDLQYHLAWDINLVGAMLYLEILEMAALMSMEVQMGVTERGQGVHPSLKHLK